MNWLATARQETFAEVEEILYRVGRIFFDQEEAKSEAGFSFLYAYDKFNPKKNPDFEQYAGQITYYRGLSELKRRKKYRERYRQFKVIAEVDRIVTEESLLEDRLEIDHNRIWYFVEGLPDDARYVATFVLNPPKRIGKIIQENCRHDDVKGTRLLWRKVLNVYLRKKKWTQWRINKAFDVVNHAITAKQFESYSTMGG